MLVMTERVRSQTVSVPLNCNFNGILHVGEGGQPDAPGGFRSISDRALDFSGGVPVDPVLAPYALIASPGVLDIVHLGNRNTVDNGNWAFDPFPDGDNVGIQPNWLGNPDQGGPQTTVLATPILLDAMSSASFLFQISNGGGSFQVTLGFQSGNSSSYTLSGPDWFGGTFLGRDSVDQANVGNNLNVREQAIGLTGNAGELLTQVTFHSRTNPGGGCAILAMNVEPAPAPVAQHAISLACNFNGLVHAGESGVPDDPDGFRSISDRALDFSAGVPSQVQLTPFTIVDSSGVLDIVHLGNRDTVAGGIHAFDPLPDGDDVGIQPNWLPNVDQTGPQATTLAQPVLLDIASSVKLLFQISDGGGAFDVTLSFSGGSSITSVLRGGDWLGGPFAGADLIDRGSPGPGLGLEVGTVSLGGAAGLVLTGIEFGNRSNLQAGYAILAATVSGTITCGSAGSVTDLGGGNGPSLTSPSTNAYGTNLVWNVAGASPGAPLGFVLLGFSTSPVPLASFFGACSGTIHPTGPTSVGLVIDSAGTGSLILPGPVDPVWCSLAVAGQYAELVVAACPVLLSNGLVITIGD